MTVFGRVRLGHDVFLGEVMIPLREVEGVADVQAPDVRRYILGRRNAKEKVVFRIALFVCFHSERSGFKTEKVPHR